MNFIEDECRKQSLPYYTELELFSEYCGIFTYLCTRYMYARRALGQGLLHTFSENNSGEITDGSNSGDNNLHFMAINKSNKIANKPV